MAVVAKKLKDPLNFPGGQGEELTVTTNMFNLRILKSNVIKKVNVVAVTKDKDKKIVTMEGNKVFSLFKKAYCGRNGCLKDIKHIVEGYPAKDGITVYVVTATKELSFTEKKFGDEKIAAKYCGSISINDWNTFDNDLKMFLKKAFVATIYEMFDKHQYTLMKRVIYSFKTKGNFPAVFLNNIFQLLPGIRLGYECDIQDENDPTRSNNLVSINYSPTVATRTSVSLLKCYEDLCTEVIATLTHKGTRGIAVHAQPDQKIPPKCVTLMNEVFQNLQVYIPYESDKKKHFYYKLIEILPKSATHYLQADGKVPIIADCERLYKIKIQYPGMNAALIKSKGKEYYVPLEILMLSDKPQRVSASASYILTHLTERIKELAALVPGKRWEYIRDAAGKFHTALMDNPKKPNLLNEIGLEVDDNPITVKARVLDPPVDTYSEAAGTLAIPYPNPVEYVVVDFSQLRNDENQTVEENVKHLMDKMREKFGISITDNQSLKFFKFNYDSKNAVRGNKKALEDLDTVVQWHDENKLKKSGRKLLYVAVIENTHKATSLHGLIKQKFEKNGMTSQVITVGVLHNTRTVTCPSYRRPSESKSPEDYNFNIVLQINAKLGGVNCVPSKKESNKLWHEYINDENPTMFIGIDTRLSSKERNKQSVVAVVTSIDTTGTRYDQSFEMSKEGRYTSDLGTVITKAIDCFKDSKENSIVPKNFMIFRAGMNEYELTAKTGEGPLELEKINVAINNYMKTKRINIVPKLTYIGYNRSHNFRCYNAKDEASTKEEDGVKLNCPVGTVIDSTVTNKDCFYLISHETFLGTTKPPKYRVVHGMRNYKVDNLLAIVYQLCRLNPQAKQSFRRPAPIGLASKLLDRIVEKCPTIFDGKDEDIQNLMSHPDFKNISYYI